jgi:hypothetical protein
MTILSVRGTPVTSGRVRKTVRMSTGRCNPHGATQNQRGLHRSLLAPTAQCTCRGSGPSPALWQPHKPDDTPVKVHFANIRAPSCPGRLSQATPAGSVETTSQAAWQGNMPACNRQRAVQIRRHYDPDVRLCGRGQREYSHPRGRTLANLMDRATAGPQRGRPLTSPWLFYSRYVRPHRIRPCRRVSISLRRETAEPVRGRSGHR